MARTRRSLWASNAKSSRTEISKMATMSEDAEQGLRERVQEAERRIFEHPGYLELVRCETLRRTLTAVFVPNWQELLALLDRAATDVGLALELIQNVHRPDVRERFEAATVQRLHNYVAGTMTLVDHTRRIMRARSGAIPDEFAKRKALLLANPEVPFVQDLRNFTLHRSLPFLGHTLSLSNVNTPGQQMECEVELSVAELAASDGWSPSSRAYLLAQDKAVALRPVIRRHGEFAAAINSWLHDALAKANEQALADVNRLVVERNAILSGTDAATAARLTQHWTRLRQTPAAEQSGDVAAFRLTGDDP
jgi:hypothetical protein